MSKKTDDVTHLDEDFKGWKRWNAFVDAANQPERLWLAELEARVDRLDSFSDSDWALIDMTAIRTIDLLREELNRKRSFATFWGRLKWLVRG